MELGQIVGIVLGILSIVSILVGVVIALIKVFSKMAVILSSINNEIVQIKLMFKDYDERLEDIEGGTEDNTMAIALIKQKIGLE